MRCNSQGYDEEAAQEPLLQAGSGAGGGSGASSSGRGPSPERTGGGGGEEGQPHLRSAATPGGSIRLTKRSSTAAHDGEDHQDIVLKDSEDGGKQDNDVREFQLEVEVVAGAVAEAVAEAVQEAVAEAVHDAVQQAIEDNVQFDVRANVYTLIAVTGVILFWRGVWNTWDTLFGADSLYSNLGSMVLGLAIMSVIRMLDLPLVQGLPGG